MNVTRSTLATSLTMAILVAVVLLGSQSRPAADAETTELFSSAVEATNDNSTVLLLAQADTPSKPAAASKSDDGKPVLLLKYGDGKADGKKGKLCVMFGPKRFAQYMYQGG